MSNQYESGIKKKLKLRKFPDIGKAFRITKEL